MSNYFVIGNSESRNMIFGVDNVAGSIQSISSGATSAYAHLTFNQNGGNVGIGSATPYSLFTVKSSYSGGTTGGFCLDANDGAAYRLFLYPYVQGGGQVAYQFNVQNAGTTYTSLVLGYNGSVGIGTTVPASKLSVQLDGTGIFNPASWYTSGYAVFGPNAGNIYGGAVGITYNSSSDYGALLSLAPSSAWKPMYYSASIHYFKQGDVSVDGTITATTMTASSSINVLGTVHPTINVSKTGSGGNYIAQATSAGAYIADAAENDFIINSRTGNTRICANGTSTTGILITNSGTTITSGLSVSGPITSNNYFYMGGNGSGGVGDYNRYVSGTFLQLQGTSRQYIYATSADNAAYGVNTNNLVIQSWYGIGFADLDGYARAFINTRNGAIHGSSINVTNVSCTSISATGNTTIDGYLGIGGAANRYPLEINNAVGWNSAYTTLFFYTDSVSNGVNIPFNNAGGGSGYGNNLVYYAGQYVNWPGAGAPGAGQSAAYMRASIYARGMILCGAVTIFSDRRIKKNIEDLSSNISLEAIRKLNPKIYQFIDIKSGDVPKIGFIAQDVEKVIDIAVNHEVDFIPNIYQCSTVQYDPLGTIFILDKEITSEFKENTVLRIYLDETLTDKEVTIMKSSSKMIQIKEQISDVKRVFLYGTNVDDKKTIDNDMIFTVGISAIQELDKIIQLQSEQLKLQSDDINQLKEKLNKLEEFIYKQALVL